MLPGWQQVAQPLIEAGKLGAIGVVQEQHPERAQLYAQWRQLGWALYVDALNELDHKVVPIVLGVDEAGVVHRLADPAALAVFAERPAVPAAPAPAAMPQPRAGDAPFHAGRIDAAIDAYRAELVRDPLDARVRFRLGVALQRRDESEARRVGDGQEAVRCWSEALAQQPDQYIWRRRLQQYGPRLDKPYDFYGWVATARAEIRARGEQPLPLAVEPRGTELAGPGPRGPAGSVDPDPTHRIPLDAEGLVGIELIAVPERVRPGRAFRLRIVLRPGSTWWNNEAEPLAAFVAPGPRLTVVEGPVVPARPAAPETREVRVVECELAVAEDAPPGEHRVGVRVVYAVCTDQGGVCQILRRELELRVVVDRAALSLGK